jgi:hypothetical protein
MSEGLAETAQPEVDVEQERKATWRAIIVVALIAALVAGGWWLSGSGERSAQHACAEYVKGKIRNPGSADFSFGSTLERGGSWEVDGTVDADRRYRFSCTVTSDGVTGSAL